MRKKKEYKYSLKITVDTNDADYISNEIEITEEELMLITEFVIFLKDNKIRFGRGEVSDITKSQVEMIEAFNTSHNVDIYEYFPFPEYGFHSVACIQYAPLIEWKRISLK